MTHDKPTTATTDSLTGEARLVCVCGKHSTFAETSSCEQPKSPVDKRREQLCRKLRRSQARRRRLTAGWRVVGMTYYIGRDVGDGQREFYTDTPSRKRAFELRDKFTRNTSGTPKHIVVKQTVWSRKKVKNGRS